MTFSISTARKNNFVKKYIKSIKIVSTLKIQQRFNVGAAFRCGANIVPANLYVICLYNYI